MLMAWGQRTMLKQKKAPKQATNPLEEVITQMWFFTFLRMKTHKLYTGFNML